MSGSEKINVKVSNIVPLNDLVTRFEFKRTDGKLFPTFSGGAHTVIELKDGDITRRNPYSLMSDPMDQEGYSISVRRDDAGRGGSLFLHNNIKVGDDAVLSHPVNDLISMHPNDVNVYYDDHKNFVDIVNLLDGQPLGTHLYICGPKGMIDWVVGEAKKLGWPSEVIHFEEFLAPKPGEPFQVKLSASNKVINVGENESLLEAIEREGVDAPYLCRGGACGQCETSVIEADGDFVHRDHWLEDDEKLSRKKIMPCVSRFSGKTLVLDR